MAVKPKQSPAPARRTEQGCSHFAVGLAILVVLFGPCCGCASSFLRGHDHKKSVVVEALLHGDDAAITRAVRAHPEQVNSLVTIPCAILWFPTEEDNGASSSGVELPLLGELRKGELTEALIRDAKAAGARQERQILALPLRPLHLATMKGDTLAIRRLLDAGANPNLMADGKTALALAVTARDHVSLAALLSARATKINEPADQDGQTALHIAAMSLDLDAIILLLAHGADPNRRVGGQGDGPTALWLLAKGYTLTSRRWEPAEIAFHNLPRHAGQRVARASKIARLLIGAGGDPSARSGGENAVEVATREYPELLPALRGNKDSSPDQ